jgi:V/A-type H+-transporting ATPase subunit C
MARLDRVNARVGALRSRLVGADVLRELLVRPSLEARIDLLVRSGRLAAPPTERGAPLLDAVEATLRDGLRRDEARLLREVEGERSRGLLAAALGLREGQLVKVLLRGTAFGAPPDRLVALAPPTAWIPEGRLRELAESTSPEALAEKLARDGSPFAAPLRAALVERDRAGLLPAEVAIDRVAFGRVAESARGRGEDAAALADWLAARADARNALTLLALGANVPSRDLFVPGGRRIGAEAYARLARAGVEARRRAAAALVPCAPERLSEPAAAERLLEGAATRRLRLAARRAPLSLAVPLAWIEARREEIHRIAVVLRGAALGLPGDAILDLVEA